MSLLDRDSTPDDIEAERDQPRPGVWAGEPGADLRALTQDETDALVRYELCWQADEAERHDVATACGQDLTRRESRIVLSQQPSRWVQGTLREHAATQRGGIDSDPLVRVLARRAWGDRDRQWFELRGVRKGEAVAKMMSGAVALAWPGDRTRNADILLGRATHDARPGEEVQVVGVDMVTLAEFANGKPPNYGMYRVSDRLREPPVRRGVDESDDEAMFRVEFGFDHVWIDRDHARMSTTVTAERGGMRSQCIISDTQLRASRSPGALLAERIRDLDAWLTAHGAPRADLAQRLARREMKRLRKR